MKYSLKRNALHLSIVFCVALLGACASVPRQPLDKQAASDIKRIAVLEVDDPPEYLVLNVGGAGSMFGLIGGLIQAADAQSKTDKFSASAKDLNFYLGREFGAQLKQALEQRGYQVSYMTGVRSKKNVLEQDYQRVPTDADAILDVVIVQTGYYSGAMSSYYVPWLRMTAKLVSTKTQKVLYQQTYAYGEEVQNIRGIEFIKPDTRYEYHNFDELKQKKDEAIEGLRNAQSVVAGRIVEAL